MEKYRADTFWTKEPETIAWIESFGKDEVFFDVGANIGIYSLYAAHLYLDMKIYAFEPHLGNFRRLLENIQLNEFTNIFAYNYAISNMDRADIFYANSTVIGTSGGQVSMPIDENNNMFIHKQEHHVLTTSIESFCERYAAKPNHVKIDIDGAEEKVLWGINLEDPALKSILVEFNHDATISIRLLRDYGFSIDNHFNRMEHHSRFRRRVQGIRAENIIFTRI